MRELQVNSGVRDGRQVFTLVGEINLETAPQLHETLLAAIERSPATIVLDLARVNYMDSSGVGTLVDIKRRVSKAHGEMILLSPQKMVRSVLEITQLTRFFTIVDAPDAKRPT